MKTLPEILNDVYAQYGSVILEDIGPGGQGQEIGIKGAISHFRHCTSFASFRIKSMTIKVCWNDGTPRSAFKVMA